MDNDAEDWRERTLKVNLPGTNAMIRRILPRLLKGNEPRILNFPSGAAVIHGSLEKGAQDIASRRFLKVAVNSLILLEASRVKGQVSVLRIYPGLFRTGRGGPGAPETMVAEVTRIMESPALPWKSTGKFRQRRASSFTARPETAGRCQTNFSTVPPDPSTTRKR